MGGHDQYCFVCGAPFTSFNSYKIEQLKDIDTDWLADAVLEYYKDGKVTKHVSVCYYDGYGRFEDKAGTEYDVLDAIYDKEVKVLHTACQAKSSPKGSSLRKYQQQFFMIDALVADNKQHMLIKPE